ncbi:hypothetical protein HMPREF1991_02787 [Hoylesella loescheii DSM 19665 = JCM 12249 = ATCC 15930]|uniref:Uncharacterized protein n=1 Tax=Hoylesella loescheii DSM 19665 = JCM 12249 = ATCC 15930 TaxID=1122985 RepID=A0A069QET3_HOYLO|nr:hypothetical protein HMPREF1991_02787 [Hoylesella loescheii DSM 19665 = JCM 12249 = ATCC 15930]
MAFGGWKGELLAMIDCRMNRLDGAKLTSNVTKLRDKGNSLCQLPHNTSWRDSHLFFI